MELTGPELEELLAAWALDALDDEERARAEQLLADNARLRVEAERLQEVASWLGTEAASAPPPHLRQAVLAEATSRRPRGVAAGSWTVADPVEAYAGQAEELATALEGLSGDDWSAHTVPGWTVRELVAHLLAVEEHFGWVLGAWEFTPPPGTEHDHVAMTLPTIEEHRTVPPERTAEEWRARVEAVVSHLESGAGPGLDSMQDYLGVELPLRALLARRAFELWIHADDVRRAAGRALTTPEPGRLHLMADLAVDLLPVGLGLTGHGQPDRMAKVVLTGAGGGAWFQPLSPQAVDRPPDVTLVADIVDFCRLVARRADFDEVDIFVEGDEHLARDLLVGVQAFAE